MESIKEVLMQRDGLSEIEAQDLINMATKEIFNCIESGNFNAAEDVCWMYLGLEPDYIEQLVL